MAKGEKSLKVLKAKEKLSEEEKHSFINALPLNSHIKVKLNNEDVICKIEQHGKRTDLRELIA